MGVMEVRNLNLTLGEKTILNDVNIDFWDSHVHAVVGPNGAGKSTLAFTIMGLSGYRNFSGDILFEGQSIADMNIDERARLGISLGWQEPARYEGLSTKDFIMAAAKEKKTATVKNALEMVGLDPDEYLYRAVDRSLSGGERKRIELASLLAMKPKFVLLDEPDSGIDVEALERIFDAIRILKSGGTTIILITHSLTVLQQAEHAFLMCHGTIFDKGTVDKIKIYFENKCIHCNHKNMPAEDEIL